MFTRVTKTGLNAQSLLHTYRAQLAVHYVNLRTGKEGGNGTMRCITPLDLFIAVLPFPASPMTEILGDRDHPQRRESNDSLVNRIRLSSKPKSHKVL